jgi:hypothetical protein
MPITRYTAEQMIAQVGAKLDLEITENTVPDKEQVVQWLNDASLYMAKILPAPAVSGITRSFKSDSVGSQWELPTGEILRVLVVRKFGNISFMADMAKLSWVATNVPMTHTSRNPICAVSGSGGNTVLEFFPRTNAPAEVIAVVAPEQITAEGWTPGEYAPPPSWALGMVDYAVIQGKIQDEEPEQAAFLLKSWQENLQVEMGSGFIGMDE